MNITRKCKKCGRLNIETEIKIFMPFNNSLDFEEVFSVWDLIDSGEETGVYFCYDCKAIVETEVVQT